MYTSEGIKLRAIESQLAEQQKLTWGLLVLGVAIGFVGMHFIVARPMTRELERMQRDIVAMESRMQELTGATDQAWEANSLLSSLKAQRSQLEEAREVLQSMTELRSEVVAASQSTGAARTAVAGMSELQQQIIAQEQQTGLASMAYEQMMALENRLVDQQSTHQAAQAASSELIALKSQAIEQSKDLPAAFAAIEQSTKLQQQILAQRDTTAAATADLAQAQEVARQSTALLAGLKSESANIEAAQAGLQGLVTLRQHLQEGAQFNDIAGIVADHLLYLQERLVGEVDGVDVAQERMQRLITLNETAQNGDIDVVLAERNLVALIRMEAMLKSQTSQVADAIQSLELLTAFQEEFSSQIQLLGEMRRSLIELGMMESSVVKAVKMIEPLLELGNVNRLSDEELRGVARTILERRGARLADSQQAEPKPENTEVNAPVPAPQDE